MTFCIFGIHRTWARKPSLKSEGGKRLFFFQGLEYSGELCYALGMKLTAKVKLNPTPEQAEYLLQTLETANAACDDISQRGWKNKAFGRDSLHQLSYYAIRDRYGLTAQMAVRCIGKVADAYKKDKETQRTFRKHGAIAYDDRILKWYTDKHRVSIWSVGGRLNIPYQSGDYQDALLQSQKGESDLVYLRGEFYLLATCDIPDPDEKDTENALGIDMGVTNIATTSDGDILTSEVVEANRLKNQRLRRSLQKRQTDSALRKLKRLAGKQARFQRDVNHCIAKKLVECAVHTNRAIAVEDLTHIRTRTRVKGTENRAKHSNWAFAQLRDFIDYKAKQAGIPVIAVNPAYTSQRCFACGHVERANRKSQRAFLCVRCGHSAHADVNAAKNIAWAALNPPNVGMSA